MTDKSKDLTPPETTLKNSDYESLFITLEEQTKLVQSIIDDIKRIRHEKMGLSAP